jgi:2-oxoglutarate ferredoxin oxidoreductase subunit alpha
MNEFISFLGCAEVPLLIVDSQRPAPATGLPTWTEQGDLLYAIHAGHGDFPKIVLAPGDPEEAYYLTADALNLAEEYQVPVILLLDKNLSESNFTIPLFEPAKITVEHGKLFEGSKGSAYAPFKRYAFDAKDGVSPRALPGIPGGIHVTNSDEHDEYGYSIEGGETRAKMVEKRMKKLEAIRKRLPKPLVHGDNDTETVIVSWGSTQGVILDALEELKDGGQKVKFVQIQYLWPFPDKILLEETSKAKKTILVENNYSGQLGTLLKQAGVKIDRTITKYNGQPFFRNELINQLEKLL